MFDIFADNICFQIYFIAGLFKTKRCFFGGVRNKRYAETAAGNFRYGKADAVNGNAAFFYYIF